MRQDSLFKLIKAIRQFVNFLAGFIIALTILIVSLIQYIIIKPSIIIFRVLAKLCFIISELLVALDKKIKQ